MSRKCPLAKRYRACSYPGLVVLSLCTVFAAASAVAQEVPEMVTDRPDQSESASIVPPGFVQLELGPLFTRDDEGGVEAETWNLPGTLARIGLHERVELRLGWGGYVTQEVRFAGESFDVDGLSDADVGLKVRLRDEKGGGPEIAFLAAASVPVGDEALTSDHVDPSFRFAFGQTLSERVSIGYNVGMSFESGPDDEGDVDTVGSYLYTFVVGVGVGKRAGVFFEVFGDVPASAPGDPAHSFDAGLTYLVRDNVQLDLAAGFGLSDEADDFFVGAGISIRFPR